MRQQRRGRPAVGTVTAMVVCGTAAALACLAQLVAPAGVAMVSAGAFAIAATLVVLVTAARGVPRARAAWWLLAVGMIAWLASDIRVRTLPADTPTEPVDVGFLVRLLAYAALIGGAFLLVRGRQAHRDTTTVTDSLIVLTAGAALLTWTTLDNLTENSAIGPGSTSVLAGYAILDLLLLSVVVRLWFASARSTTVSIRLVSGAFLAMLLADLSWQFLSTRGTGLMTAPPGWVDALLVAFFALLALAALHPSVANEPVGDDSTATVGRTRVLALLLVCMLLPPLALLLLDREWELAELLGLIGLIGMLTILIALRVSLLLLDYQLLVNRGDTLVRATDSLAAAEDAAAVDAQLPSWVTALGTGSPARPLTGELVETPAAPTSRVTAFPLRESGGFLQITSRRALDEGLRSALALLAHTAGEAHERLELRERLVEQTSRERVESLLRHTTDLVVLVAADRRMEFATAALTPLTGLTPDGAVGMDWAAMFTDREAAGALLERARTGADEPGRGELTTGDGTGASHHLDVVARWLPEEQRFVVTHHDVTERLELQEALRQQAFHDPLTGLANRVVFRDQLARALQRVRRSPTEFVMMMIDLDEFKQVNDTLGHPAGDDLLRTVADRLTGCLREGDLAARLGGDEFAVILENTWSTDDAEVVAQRILAAVGEPIVLGSTEVVVGASIGVAVGSATTGNADELTRDADLALYRAKSGGKNQFQVFSPGLHEEAVAQLTLTSELRRAIDDDAVGIAYQPIVDLTSGAIAGLEALARWDHPTLGRLSPDEFIPLAETSGLITRLGLQVMQRAMTQVARWHRELPTHQGLRLNVNVSGRQLSRPEFPAEVARALAESGLDPRALVLEVTESLLLPGEGVTREHLDQLTAIGVGIYIDDWGTGWSSLSYLDELPVQGLKLAPDFVSGLPSPRATAVAEAVNSLARSLELQAVIAEGVETEEQRSALRELGYHLAQGYLLGAPMAADLTASLLSATPAAAWPGHMLLRSQ